MARGVNTGIGSMAEIGPGGHYAGRVVGLIPALNAVGTVGGLAAAAAFHARKKAKDFNDAETFNIVGDQEGKPIKE